MTNGIIFFGTPLVAKANKAKQLRSTIRACATIELGMTGDKVAQVDQKAQFEIEQLISGSRPSHLKITTFYEEETTPYGRRRLWKSQRRQIVFTERTLLRKATDA